jgi:hypothetical protein
VTLGAGDWSQLGLSRFAVYRALSGLEADGLVRLERRPGARAHVRILRIDPLPPPHELYL